MSTNSLVPESGTYRILLVEDDPELMGIFRTIIQTLGDHVSLDTAFDVELAEALLSTRPADLHYDLVITDINLPGKRTGLDLISLCREKIPQIIMSSISEAEYLQSFQGTGMKPPPFLQKPFPPREMLEIIKYLGGFKNAA